MMARKASDPTDTPLSPLADETRLVTAGRDPQAQYGFVNPPVYHGSTVLYPTAADLIAHRARYTYGRRGTPTSEALQDALQALEGERCAGVALLPSGMAAVSAALLTVVRAGDHVLVSDSVYRPARVFCDTILARLGVETTYFDPLIADGFAELFRPNTRVLYLEAPGSQSFEMQDIPRLASIGRQHNAVVISDNTWATPLFFRPLDHGVDLVIQAGTKYIVGHSDVMLGTVSANEQHWPALKEFVAAFGLCVGPDDIYLSLRGLRTMAVRLQRHQDSALAVARWLAQRPEVSRVMHPALETDPGHEIWKRDFKGASGLFSVILKPAPEAAVHAMLDSLTLFGMGFSWGGYESLVIPFDCSGYRTATKWNPGGPALRFHIGLEDVSDLTADLEQGFARMAAAM
jgi:cysteine-S-conjugate beta-lyase